MDNSGWISCRVLVLWLRRLSKSCIFSLMRAWALVVLLPQDLNFAKRRIYFKEDWIVCVGKSHQRDLILSIHKISLRTMRGLSDDRPTSFASWTENRLSPTVPLLILCICSFIYFIGSPGNVELFFISNVQTATENTSRRKFLRYYSRKSFWRSQHETQRT